jgi:hypothetical protein
MGCYAEVDRQTFLNEGYINPEVELENEFRSYMDNFLKEYYDGDQISVSYFRGRPERRCYFSGYFLKHWIASHFAQPTQQGSQIRRDQHSSFESI